MDEETIQKCVQAGKIAAQVRREGAAKFVVGASVLEVMDFCEKRIGGSNWGRIQLSSRACGCRKYNRSDCTSW